MSNYVRCPTCNGTKRMTGIGGMHHDCDFCLAVGWVTEGNENENIEDHAEQDHLQDSQDSQRKKDVDQGASDNSKGKRKRDRKAAVGTGEQDLSEREAGEQGSEEIKSGEQLQKEQVNVG